MNPKGLIFLIFLLVVTNSSAQKILQVNSIEQANSQINNYIYLYVDSTNTLDINQVIEKKDQDQFLSIKEFNTRRLSNHTYWLYLAVENNLPDNNDLGLWFAPVTEHIVEVYSLSDSIMTIQQTGFYRNGDINDEVFPLLNLIAFEHKRRTEFYIKINYIFNQSHSFSVSIVDPEKKIRQSNRLMAFDGFANGMMVIMILYGLYLYFTRINKLYIYYSLYIFILIIWYFMIPGYGYRLFPGLPRNLYPYGSIPSFVAFIFYIQFIRLFIDSKKTMPGWDKVLRIFQIILAIEIVRIPVFLYLTYSVDLNAIILNIISVALLIWSVAFIIKLFLTKSRLTRIIAIGSSCLILGFLSGLILFLVANDNSFFFNKIGILSELIVFTYGITYKYSLIEEDKRKYQEQLIIQLEENADLQLKVNRELSERVREATAELVAKNEAITDSIQYASLIQTAVLPPLDFITELGFENFILYKPQAIVSGDFYWGKRKDGKVIIAAADCTGHGVPGAFMSMLGHAFIEEIVTTGKTDNPAAILNHLREDVIRTMKQKGSKDEAKDGMDISLCIIDREGGKLEFSGANNDLYFIRDRELIKIKADKMPVGINELSKVPFNNHNLGIMKGDILYLFSDGFADQFGGPKRKRFMYKPFQDLLIQIHMNPMDQQRNILEARFEEWKGKNEQVDDVMVIGIKI